MHRTRYLRLALFLLILVLGGGVWLANTSAVFGRLSWLAYDLEMQWLQPQPRTDQRIVVVDIDDASLARLGRWPWSRMRLAALLESIRNAEPAVVGLDILLPEPADPLGDRALRQQLANPDVVAAIAYGDLETRHGQWPHATTRLGVATTLESHDSAQPSARWPITGHITPTPASDGRLRWIYPRICDTQHCSPTLALAMLEQFTGLPARLQQVSRFGIDEPAICVASYCQWLDTQRRLLLPYQLPVQFIHVSAADVLEGQATDLLTNALVLVGTSAAGLGDLVATPRSAYTPGVDLHALLLSAWLDSHHWVALPFARWVQLGGLALCGLGIVWGVGRRSSWRRASLLLPPALAMLAMPYIWLRLGYWFDPLPWVFASVGGLVGVAGYQGWQLRRQNRHLQRAFSAYVPAQVLRQLVRQQADPRRLDAQRCEVSVMFADINGFTALSESLEPDQLVKLTSRLFTELTHEIYRHNGTLDKYIGDAVMAFWGAPLPDPEHASQALACVHAMQARLTDLRPWLEAQGFPSITLTIGIESGLVTVGNLGSRQRRAYTVLGRAVNVASRLEDLCQPLGQSILIGPGMAKALEGRGLTRELGCKPIRGISGSMRLSVPASMPVGTE